MPCCEPEGRPPLPAVAAAPAVPAVPAAATVHVRWPSAPRAEFRAGAFARVLALGLGMLLGAHAVNAQPALPAGHRVFPSNALRAELLITTPPEASLNGQAVRLAPGARIRGEDNLQRLAGTLTGQSLLVHYTLEPTTGLLMNVWILTPAERANTPWPTSVEQARSWRFDAATQRWSPP